MYRSRVQYTLQHLLRCSKLPLLVRRLHFPLRHFRLVSRRKLHKTVNRKYIRVNLQAYCASVGSHIRCHRPDLRQKLRRVFCSKIRLQVGRRAHIQWFATLGLKHELRFRRKNVRQKILDICHFRLHTHTHCRNRRLSRRPNLSELVLHRPLKASKSNR